MKPIAYSISTVFMVSVGIRVPIHTFFDWFISSLCAWSSITYEENEESYETDYEYHESDSSD